MRVIALSNHPTGFTPDEASFGYDAYSILKTGKDQWGRSFPLSLRSFGDYKLPLYAYLDIPFVAVFGLNEFAVRLPNAILGSLSILVVYFLVKEVFKRQNLAILTALLLAISPWHIPMSRGAFEANLTTFLLPLALFFFFKACSFSPRELKRAKLFVLSALIFGLNLFSYHSARLLTPLLLLGLIWFNRSRLDFKRCLPGLIVFCPFLLLAGYSLFFGAGSRLSSAGIFSLASNVRDARYSAVLAGLPDFTARIFNNKLTFVFSTFLRNYFSYFSPQFFFSQGPGEGTYGMLPGKGVLYTFELFLLLAFVWAWLTGKIKKLNWLIFWIFISPIPAALSIGPGYAANRVLFMVPALQIISGIGGIYLYFELKEKLPKYFQKLIIPGASLILLVSFAFFLEDYFVQQPATQAKAMIYGTREIMEYLGLIEGEYEEIIFTKKISEPQIFVAFYKKIEPAQIQEQSGNWKFEEKGLIWLDQLDVYHLDKYTFKTIDWKLDLLKQNVLVIGSPEEFPQEIKTKKIIRYPNGTDAYWLVES